MLTWRYKATPRLHHFQARKVVIATDPPVPVQIDGEDMGLTPLEAEIVPGGVHLIVGARYREKAGRRRFPGRIQPAPDVAQESRLTAPVAGRWRLLPQAPDPVYYIAADRLFNVCNIL